MTHVHWEVIRGGTGIYTLSWLLNFSHLLDAHIPFRVPFFSVYAVVVLSSSWLEGSKRVMSEKLQVQLLFSSCDCILFHGCNVSVAVIKTFVYCSLILYIVGLHADVLQYTWQTSLRFKAKNSRKSLPKGIPALMPSDRNPKWGKKKWHKKQRNLRSSAPER